MFAGLFEPIHLLLILGVVLLVFGPGKLAAVGRDLGKSVREFRSAMEAAEQAPRPTPELAREDAGAAAIETKQADRTAG